jgi:hypothetical protein
MRAPFVWLGFLGRLALVALPAPAVAQKVGPEFQVNTYTTAWQGEASIATDASGNFVVVWEGYGAGDEHVSGIFGQRYDSNGMAQGGEFHVNSYTTGTQRSPSVASDASGNFVVVWKSYDQDGDRSGIFGQRYDSDGMAQGAEFRVNSYTTNSQNHPSAASDANGNFVVVWESYGQDGSAYGVFGQRFDSAGAPLGGEFRVNSYTSSDQDRPSVSSAADGKFVVVWESGGPDGDWWGIVGQRYDSTGTTSGAEFQINSYTTGWQRFPSVASDASGNFVVAWESLQDGSGYGAFGQRYDSTGTALGGEFQINSYTTTDQRSPSVASDTSGNFVVVWESYRQDGSQHGVFAQSYDSAGVAQGNEFMVNSFTLSSQFEPAVVANDADRFVVAWTGLVQDGSSAGVFAQRLNMGPDTTPPNVTVATPNGGEKVFTGSSYGIGWAASDDVALSSFDAFSSVDGGQNFTPIAECQRLPASARSCVWLAPGPPSPAALVRVVAEDTSGNPASDDSDATLAIVPGLGSVTVGSPRANAKWQIDSVQAIEWTHDLGSSSTFRIELDRYNDGRYEDLIAAAAPATSPTEGSFAWTVTGPRSATARVRVSWTASPAVSGSSDASFWVVGPPRMVSEFQVNTYTTGSQLTASQGNQPTLSSNRLIAADGSGNFMVVWISDGQDGDATGIFGQRYGSAGEPLGTEFRVNSFTTSLQDYPSVAAAAGGFVVVWQSRYQDGSGNGIFGQRYDSAGSPQGGEFRVNSFTRSDQFSPSIASDASGNFVVVWSSPYHPADHWNGIFGQRYDKESRPLGGEFHVNSYTTGNQWSSSVASDAGGNFIVVWESHAQDGSGYGIFGQRYDRDGVALGGEFRVNSYTTDGQVRPFVASDAVGNFVVVWEGHKGQDGSADGIFGQRYDSSGTALGGEFQVNSYTTSNQQNPSVAASTDGDFIVAWASYRQDGSRDGVFGQRYDNSGAAQGNEFQVNSYTTDSQMRPSVGATATNQFVVAWTSDYGSGTDVFGRRLSADPDTAPPSVTVAAPDGGETLFTGSSYEVQWSAADDTALSSFELAYSVDGGQSFTPIAECQHLPGSVRSCLWLAPGPPSQAARIRIKARDTSGNSASDDSNSVFGIVSGSGAVSVVGPNAKVKWRIGSQQQIQWTHNLGANAAFRIELDRYNDGVYEELIAAAAPALAAGKGRFNWTVTGPLSAVARVRVSWSDNLAVSDSTDGTFQIRPPAFGER